MTSGDILLGAISLAAGGVGTYVALKFEPLKEAVTQEKADREKALKEQAELYEKRIDALHADKKDLERRMNEVEKNALTRGELDAVRRDMEAAVERMGDRVMEHFDRTAARLEKRVEKMEAVRD